MGLVSSGKRGGGPPCSPLREDTAMGGGGGLRRAREPGPPDADPPGLGLGSPDSGLGPDSGPRETVGAPAARPGPVCRRRLNSGAHKLNLEIQCGHSTYLPTQYPPSMGPPAHAGIHVSSLTCAPASDTRPRSAPGRRHRVKRRSLCVPPRLQPILFNRYIIFNFTVTLGFMGPFPY